MPCAVREVMVSCTITNLRLYSHPLPCWGGGGAAGLLQQSNIRILQCSHRGCALQFLMCGNASVLAEVYCCHCCGGVCLQDARLWVRRLWHCTQTERKAAEVRCSTLQRAVRMLAALACAAVGAG